MEPSKKKPKMASKNKNYKKYSQPSKKQALQVGQRGFLVMCNMNEKSCVRECYNMLNHYADILYGSNAGKQEEVKTPLEVDLEAKAEKSAAKDDSDSDDLQAAVAKFRELRTIRFQNVETGTPNCLFINTLQDDPIELGKFIMSDVAEKGKTMSRFVLRLVPIEVVCRADIENIVQASSTLFDKHFKEPTTYGIIFNHRYNQQVKREDIVTKLAEVVNSKNEGNKVDLQNPKKSIVVEILRGRCLLSVIDSYLKFKKYNLFELARLKEPNKIESTESKTKTEKLPDQDNATETESK